jgi:hypothetical protein
MVLVDNSTSLILLANKIKENPINSSSFLIWDSEAKHLNVGSISVNT